MFLHGGNTWIYQNFPAEVPITNHSVQNDLPPTTPCYLYEDINLLRIIHRAYFERMSKEILLAAMCFLFELISLSMPRVEGKIICLSFCLFFFFPRLLDNNTCCFNLRLVSDSPTTGHFLDLKWYFLLGLFLLILKQTLPRLPVSGLCPIHSKGYWRWSRILY